MDKHFEGRGILIGGGDYVLLRVCPQCFESDGHHVAWPCDTAVLKAKLASAERVVEACKPIRLINAVPSTTASQPVDFERGCSLSKVEVYTIQQALAAYDAQEKP